MRDPWGAVIAEANSFAPGGLQTSNWLENAYIEDVIALDVLPFTPPLEAGYSLEVALFDVHTLEALSVINLSGNPQDVKHPFASIRYRPVEGENDTNDLPVLDEGTGAALLVHAPELPDAATVGDELQFNWSWQKTDDGATGLAARLLWLAEGRQATHVSRTVPLVNGYDIAQWRVGEVFRGHHRLLVPPDLPPGQYALGVQLLDATGNPAAATITLDATMEVAVPPRQFDRPVLDFSVGVVWDNGLVLHGNRSGESGELHLVWGTRRPLPESLRLFVHLLDEQDLIAAQWDGVPVDWSRPNHQLASRRVCDHKSSF